MGGIKACAFLEMCPRYNFDKVVVFLYYVVIIKKQENKNKKLGQMGGVKSK